MNGKLRCAVFGVGRLGTIHAENLHTRIDGVELVYVVASRSESARKTAENLGGVLWTTNPDVVFEDNSIDAVIIATPTNTHYTLLNKAINSNKKVFVDKPITETVDQAIEINNLIADRQTDCMVGFNRRFDPDYVEAKNQIKAGNIGIPRYIKSISRDPGSPPKKFIKDSGGIFLDLNIHDFDIARFLMDSEVKSVQSFGDVQLHSFMHKYHDVDQAISYLEFENGEAGDVEGSRNSSYGYDVRTEVIGTEGTIQIGSIKSNNVLLLKDKKSNQKNLQDFSVKFKESFLYEIDHFVKSIQQDMPFQVDGLDGLKSLKIANAATQSFKNGSKVTIV